MSPMLIFLAIAAIFIAIATMATFGWRMVEKHTFSEFFVGQVIGEQKGKIPGFKQYIFSYKKRGKPNIVASRPLALKTAKKRRIVSNPGFSSKD